jgi:hypothetical protein
MTKKELQDIQDTVNNMFEYNLNTYATFKVNVEKALAIIKSIPDSKNIMLQNWKNLAIEELMKELNGRLSTKFFSLHPDQQKSELKFSKSAVSLTLMNVIMHL